MGWGSNKELPLLVSLKHLQYLHRKASCIYAYYYNYDFLPDLAARSSSCHLYAKKIQIIIEKEKVWVTGNDNFLICLVTSCVHPFDRLTRLAKHNKKKMRKRQKQRLHTV